VQNLAALRSSKGGIPFAQGVGVVNMKELPMNSELVAIVWC
jgi:hypothetical protein